MATSDQFPGGLPTLPTRVILASEDSGSYPFHKKEAGVLFKVTTVQSKGTTLVLEVFGRGFAPPEHLHFEQDEFLYVLAGAVSVKTDGVFTVMRTGDSVFIPRETAHAYAFAVETTCRMLISFTPALKMEEYLLGLMVDERFHDEAMLARYGMKPMGPPIFAPPPRK
jgi:quercetin dioxygenase-like cupin family protein